MKIIRDISTDGSQTWHNDKNNGFICHNPNRKGSITDPYLMVRVGDGTFWCEDHKELIYSFTSLVSGGSDAPAYMKRLAKRVVKDLAAQGGAK